MTRRNKKAACRIATGIGVVLLLASCTHLSGLDGSADYGCKAPPGVRCDSVSGNYANALHDNLPVQRQRRAHEAAGATPSRTRATDTASLSAPASALPGATAAGTALTATPLRSPARVLRLWIKPWEDSDHDLIDQGYVYVNVDHGQWLIDHAQQRIRDAYVPLRPPRSASLPAASLTTAADPRTTGSGMPASEARTLTVPVPRLPEARLPTNTADDD